MELEFTKPVSAASGNAARYAVSQWRYTPTSNYGGSKVDNQARTVSKVEVSPDRKKVFLEIANLTPGYVVHINTNGVTERGRSKERQAKGKRDGGVSGETERRAGGLEVWIRRGAGPVGG